MQRRPTPLLLAAMACTVLALAACGDDTTVSNPQGTGGSVDTLPEGCAAADGSSPVITSFEAYPPVCLVEGRAYRAVIETNHGTLHVDLEADTAPKTVNSFVNLSRAHYYDVTTCHRAIQNFVVQCGDPTGTGGGGPGYTFEDEFEGMEPYRIGSVAMANRGPDTNGSQFFIISGDDGTALPPDYTRFGQVIDDDLGLVELLDSKGNPGDGPPLEPIDIISISIEEV